MSIVDVISRRGFGRGLLAGGMAALASRAPAQTKGPKTRVPIVMTAGVSGLVLHEMALAQGYFDDFSIEPEVLTVSDGTKSTAALINGSSDICMWSGFNQLLPAIEKGARLRILAGALSLPSLAIYSRRPDIKSVKDLEGKNIGIGAPGAVLHQMISLMLKKKGVDVAGITFRNVGGNADIFKAVVAGTVDAGPSDVDVFDQQERYGVHALTDGLLWKEVPEYTNQASYASVDAIQKRRELLVRTLAAYAKVYRFVSGPESKDAFRRAREKVTGRNEEREALTQWSWIQANQPYAKDLVLSDDQINLVQNLNVEFRVQTKVLPMSAVADMSVARDALNLLG